MPKNKIAQPQASDEAINPANNENTPISSNKHKKRSKMDNAILTVLQAEPSVTSSQLVNKVVQLGGAKHTTSVYKRLAKKDYLRAEIHAIRDNNRQFLDRIVVPDALNVMRKAIRSNELDEKGKLPYVKLAIDKSFGDIHHVEQPSVIHIDSINNAQFNIASDISS